MKNNKQCNIYISCPVSEPFGRLLNIHNKLKDCDASINYWDRVNRYDNNFVKNCDIFILILPFNSFKHTIEYLPVGCKNELKQAIKTDKKIFISYVNSNKEINLYEVNIYGSIIEGVAGSAHTIYNTIDSFKNIETTVTEPNPVISPGVMIDGNSLIDQMNRGNVEYRSLKDIIDYFKNSIDGYKVHHHELNQLSDCNNTITNRRLLLKLK